jgi:hypothetical protein
MANALANVEKLEKINLILGTLDDVGEILVELESLDRMLISTKKSWENGKTAWQGILEEVQG